MFRQTRMKLLRRSRRRPSWFFGRMPLVSSRQHGRFRLRDRTSWPAWWRRRRGYRGRIRHRSTRRLPTPALDELKSMLATNRQRRDRARFVDAAMRSANGADSRRASITHDTVEEDGGRRSAAVARHPAAHAADTGETLSGEAPGADVGGRGRDQVAAGCAPRPRAARSFPSE